MVALLILQFLVPRQYAFKPVWLIMALEAAIFIVLTIANPFRINRESAALRVASLLLVGVASFATLWSVGLLTYDMVEGKTDLTAVELVRNGAAIWLTNVLVFGLWFWELDRGGPAARANNRKAYADFLFPQMATPHVADADWRPQFTDYLYVAFTNATAFSPTDAMPLSRWAKFAMMLESAISLVTVVLVIARAVNVLGN